MKNNRPLPVGEDLGEGKIKMPLTPALSQRGEGAGVHIHILFHPDYTVGLGIAPNLLTLYLLRQSRSRAHGVATTYRRWGIAPRPENDTTITAGF